MIAKLEQFHTSPNKDIALPIHPAVTLQGWVGMIQLAMVDGMIAPEEVDTLMDEIMEQPAAMEYFRQCCEDDYLVSSLYASSMSTEHELALTSPIW